VIALIFFEVAFPAAPTDSIEKRRYPSPARPRMPIAWRIRGARHPATGVCRGMYKTQDAYAASLLGRSHGWRAGSRRGKLLTV